MAFAVGVASKTSVEGHVVEGGREGVRYSGIVVEAYLARRYEVLA
jgi:hypothetical protein